jgi:hypothetical protein
MNGHSLWEPIALVAIYIGVLAVANLVRFLGHALVRRLYPDLPDRKITGKEGAHDV